MKASVIVLDAAKQQPFIDGGNPIASGLALVDPSPNMLIAFNAAPGTVAPGESVGTARRTTSTAFAWHYSKPSARFAS